MSRGLRVGPAMVVAALAALAAAGCAGESPETRLRRAIEDGRLAATRGDHDTLGRLVSEHYSDPEGRDRQELLQLVRAYLAYLEPIHVFYMEDSLRVSGPGRRAEVTLVVAVASVPLESLADVRRISADAARVELVFDEEGGDYRLVQARWSPASLSDWL